MSSSNTQAVLLVAVIFAVAVGTILYVNFASPSESVENTKKLNHKPRSAVDSIQYYNEERKSIIDCENMYPLEPQSPRFLGTIPNITVSVGQNVSMPCVVENLGTFRLAWLKLQSQTILTIHNHIITKNPRIGLSVESRTLETPCKNRSVESTITMYTLQINKVEEGDEAFYMCQMNTDPMKGQWGFLKVNGTSTQTQLTASENVNN